MSKRGESATFKLAVVIVGAGVVLGLVVASRRLGSKDGAPAPSPVTSASPVTAPAADASALAAVDPADASDGATATTADASPDASPVGAAEVAALREAVTGGDLPKVQELAARGTPLTATLERAAASGNALLVTWLLEHGVDPHEDEDAVVSPLIAADDHPEITKALLARGAKEPTILRAVQGAAPGAVTRILAKDKTRANARSDEGVPVLLVAIKDSAGPKRVALVQALLDSGADPASSHEHESALAAAVGAVSASTVGAGALDVVKALLAKGAPVDVETVLVAGSVSKSEAAPVQDALLAGKVSPEAAYLMIMNERDAKKIARIGAKGVKWTAEHPMIPPTPPLVSAARDLDVERVNALLAAGAPVDRAGEGDETPLYSAIDAAGPDSAEAAAIVTALLAKGASANKRTAGGLRPLHKAAEKGEEAIVKALLAKGANVDDEVGGTTALEVAETNGHQGVAKLLLARGAKKKKSPPAN